MKKLFAILLLVLMLYNLVGYMANFYIVKKEWRNYVQQTLAEIAGSKNLVSFQFAKTQFDTAEKEFIKNGHYYDVVKYEFQGDSIKVYCFNDDTETRLVAEYHDVLFKNTAQKTDFQHKTHLVFQLIIKEYLFEKDFSLRYPPSVFQAFRSVFYYKNTVLLHPFLDFDSPPPQGIFI